MLFACDPLTHQDPGFPDVVANKSPSVVRIYLPPDANSLLSVGDHCFRSENYINVIIAAPCCSASVSHRDTADDGGHRTLLVCSWGSSGSKGCIVALLIKVLSVSTVPSQ